jgi:hypothetical protein
MPKNSREHRKVSKASKRKLTAIVILLIVIGVSTSFVSYGLAYRGVVDFTFGGKGEVRQMYQLIAMSRTVVSTIDITHIRIRNTGSTGLTVIVTMHALNAVISTAYAGPYTENSNVQIYLPPGDGDQVVTFYLTLPVQVTTFTLSVTVGQVWDFSSMPALATSCLASIQPTVPTTLVYTEKATSPVTYQIAEQY